MAGPLAGIRVLDFGRHIAGPMCSMLLADLGAEVIRVERPIGWDDRYGGSPIAPSGDTYTFINISRNKKCISLNFERNTKAKEILNELVKRSDVVVENFSPDGAKTLGITYENLRRIKPDIIVADISAFGSTGPYAHRLGFDSTAKAMSGSMFISGPPGPPMRDPIPYVDMGTGIFATVGVLAALYHRKLTGQGQMIYATLLQTAVSYMASMISQWETGKLRFPRIDRCSRTRYVGPTDVYQAKDGRYVFVSTMTNTLWRRFCRFIGREDLATDPRFSTDTDRWEHRDILDPIVGEWVASQTAEEVVAAAEKIPIPCAFCYDETEVAHDPHVQALKMLTEVPLPDGSGTVVVGNIPIGMSGTPLKIERSFPKIGQHNEEIYCGLLGYSRDDLAKLKEEGVI